jgi:pimeloyl-ACP methyl ester carboxylesterase
MRRAWRVLTHTVLGVLLLAVVAVVTGCGYRAYRHYQIYNATRVDSVMGIDDERFIPVGGIEQWISIRGRDRANPVLLLLHGGPGIAMSPTPRNVLWSWTARFTVVQWDQRGAAKTFGRSGTIGADVTIERMARDGIEVAEYLRRVLRTERIVLVGLSWGSDLGVRMALDRPDLFLAYVGTGQGVNQGRFRIVAYRQLLAEANRRQDRQAIRELEANGPPPYDSITRATVHTKWANAFEPGQPSTARLLSLVAFDSEAGMGDLWHYARGIVTSQNHFRDAVEREDLLSLGTVFRLPFFVFQGALDNVTPVAPVREYFDSITAPRKAFELIPDAGHNAMATRSDVFLDLLVQHVLALAGR